MNRAKLVAAGSVGIIAATSLALPFYTCCGTTPGLGTSLSLLVLSYAHHIVFRFSDTAYADAHFWLVFAIAGVINTVLFAIPTSVIYFFTRSRAPALGISLQVCWFVFYLCAEFVLFPAAEGP